MPSAAVATVATAQTTGVAASPSAPVPVPIPVPPAAPRDTAPAGAELAAVQKLQTPPAVKIQPASARVAEVAFAQTPQITAVKAGGASASTAHRVSLLHRHRFGRRLGSRKATLARRHSHSRHRLHGLLRAALTVREPASVKLAELDSAPQPFGFTVEGSLTIANFDPSVGVMRTYEGESFAMGKTASDGAAISWLQYPADIHYRCDQSGNCTLIQGRVVVGSAKLTK